MNKQQKILRLEIDGRWSAEDMAISIANLGEIYTLCYAILSKIPENELAMLVLSETKIERELDSIASDLRRHAVSLQETEFELNSFVFDGFKSRIKNIAGKHFSSSSIFSPKPSPSRIEGFTEEITHYLRKDISEILKKVSHEIKGTTSLYREQILDVFSRRVRTIVNDMRQAMSSTDFRMLVSEAHSNMFADPGEALQVRAIRYGSPGFKDLIGIGEVIGHVKDILFKVIDVSSTKGDKELEQEKLSLENHRLWLENQEKELENMAIFSELLRKNGYNDAEIKKSLTEWLTKKQEPFLRLANEKKILSINLITPNSRDEN